MKTIKIVLLVLAFCACFSLTINADDGNFGEDIEFGTVADPETSETEEPATEPETSESEEQTTEPDISESEEQTTEPDISESEEVTTEPVISESEEQTSDPAGSVTEDQTTEPVASETETHTTSRPAESETLRGNEQPWALPLPVIWIAIGVVGVGGVVALVFLLKLYFRDQQEDENE